MPRTIVGRAAGRGRNCRWELDPIAAGLRTLHVKLHQQYESPAAVMELVRRVWQPDFDAMATPFSASLPVRSTVYVRPVSPRLFSRAAASSAARPSPQRAASASSEWHHRSRRALGSHSWAEKRLSSSSVVGPAW